MLWGKIIGALFGALLFLPFKLPMLGAILGMMLGNRFDRGLERWLNYFSVFSGAELGPAQETFFLVTFATIGHLAKADGRVSKSEIQHATNLMDHLKLSGKRRDAAKQAFRSGMKSDYDVASGIQRLRQACQSHFILMQLFWDIIQQAAACDGLNPSKRKILHEIAQMLGVRQHNPFGQGFQWQYVHGAQQTQQRHRYAHQTAQGPSAADAYAVLGLKSSASNDEIKKAYRSLMRQHHPDKLIAKGLPKDMVKLATEKTQQIRAAYDLLKAQRGFK